jgi:hypothetical protein
LLGLERLERRELLTGDPLALDFAPNVYVPSTAGEQQLVDKVGYDLASLNDDWQAYQFENPQESFAEYSNALSQNSLLQVAATTVAVEILAAIDLSTINSALA